MHSRKFLLLSFFSLPAPALRAQTTPTDPGVTPEGPAFVLDKYEVSASSAGIRAADLLTSVTLVGSDRLRSESVDYSLAVLNKLPAPRYDEAGAGARARAVALMKS